MPGGSATDNGGVTPDARSLQADLERLAVSRGFPVDGGQVARLLDYVRVVLDRGRAVNLTGARTLETAVEVLAWTAVAVVKAWGRTDAPTVAADLGTGNGLPGVAAAIAWPSCRVLLVERRQKKARAVEACAEAVQLENVEVLALDGREVLPRHPELKGAIDFVTVRAVGPLGETTGIVAPWLAPRGVVAHWKGAGLERAEVDAGLDAAREGGLVRLEGLEYADAFGPARIVRYGRPAGAR